MTCSAWATSAGQIPGHWYVVGDQELYQVGAPASGAVIDPTGDHFWVADEDLGAIAELEARGIEYLCAVQGDHTVQIWTADPADNSMELRQKEDAA